MVPVVGVSLPFTAGTSSRQSGFLHWFRLIKAPVPLKRLVSRRPMIQVIAESQWNTSEGRWLDILIRLMDENGNILGILGIENKVWAGEQVEQIGAYQGALIKHYPNTPMAIVFLSPDERDPNTADPSQTECPVITASYETLLTVFNQLAQTRELSPELRLLLASLKNYIRKEIIMPEAEIEKIRKRVRKLYSDPDNREAMRLIAEYMPSIRSMTDSIEKAVARSFPKANKEEWLYEPTRASNPQELKWIPQELKHRTRFSRTHIEINFMLRCDRRNPAIGDEYQFIVAAWCDSNRDREDAKKVAFPEHDWTGIMKKLLPPCWVPIWVGGNYKLSDIGDNDEACLTKLLRNGILETYPKVRRKVFANFPARKG